MRTKPSIDRTLEPRDVNRFLTGLKASDAFMNAYPDTRTTWQRMFGSPRFSWETGWLSADGTRYVFAHLSGWPPGLLDRTSSRRHTMP